MNAQSTRNPATILMWLLALAVVAAELAGPVSASEQPTQGNDIVLIGGVDNLRHVDKQAFGTINVRFANSYFGLQPFVQAGLAHGGSLYGGGGVLHSFQLARHVWLTIGTGPGLFRHKGNDPDLGCAVEFASWVEVSTIAMGRHIGLTFGHLSNAHLGSRNPGTEMIGLTLHLPSDGK